MTDKPQVIALAALIGPPPIRVHSGNRGEVRKWCRAKGVASLVVEKLTTAELAEAYNNAGSLYTLQIIAPPPKPKPAPTGALDLEQLQAMVKLAVSDVLAELREVQGEPVTETRVRELIAESMKGKVR